MNDVLQCEHILIAGAFSTASFIIEPGSSVLDYHQNNNHQWQPAKYYWKGTQQKKSG
jgi:uncharacterized metal-binding protein